MALGTAEEERRGSCGSVGVGKSVGWRAGAWLAWGGV